MLITSLLPLLSSYSLGFDLVAGPDGTVTLTVIPRKSEGSARKIDAAELRPIAITATAAEIDAELARGAEGALGELIAARKTLADQLAEQQKATKTATPKAKPAAANAPAPAPPPPAADPKPGEPVSLY